MPPRRVPSAVCLRWRLLWPDDPQCGDDEEEARGVGVEDLAHARAGHHKGTGDERTDEPRRLELCGVERDPVQQRFARDQVGQHRLPRGKLQCGEYARDDPERSDPRERRHHVSRRQATRVVQQPERAGLGDQHDLDPDEQLAPVDPVGERAARDREEQHRYARDEVDQPEVELGLAKREHDDAQSISLHPRAHIAYQRAEPEPDEVRDA